VAEIEQAFVESPFCRLRRHIGHVANFHRQSKIESARLDDHDTRHGDQHHARTQAGYLEPAWAAESKRDFDESIGEPRKCKAQPDDQSALQQRQRCELDDAEKYQ
jgi:hypothetical protein